MTLIDCNYGGNPKENGAVEILGPGVQKSSESMCGKLKYNYHYFLN